MIAMCTIWRHHWYSQAMSLSQYFISLYHNDWLISASTLFCHDWDHLRMHCFLCLDKHQDIQLVVIVRWILYFQYFTFSFWKLVRSDSWWSYSMKPWFKNVTVCAVVSCMCGCMNCAELKCMFDIFTCNNLICSMCTGYLKTRFIFNRGLVTKKYGLYFV